MRDKALFATLSSALIIVIACDGSQSESRTRPPIVFEPAAVFMVNQRSTAPVPGSEGHILVTLDDITEGQAMLNVSRDDGSAVLAPRSLREGESASFAIDEHRYRIKVELFDLEVLGEDRALLRISEASGDETSASKSVPDMDGRIEALIDSLREIEDAKFIRNGEEHTVDEAIAHLRGKWEGVKSEIRSAEDFIRNVGSKSSISGEPYRIRFADGSEIAAADWFRDRLRMIADEAP